MKKYTIKHLLFLLLLVAMAGCTEDPISMAAGKLPDEVAMSKIGGILYSEKSLTNKLAINLSEDDVSATDAIYYTLTQPTASAVTVTAIADETLVDTYNETNLTSLKALPAANVQFEKGGTLTVAAGKQVSEKIKVTISKQGLEAGTTYLLPLTIAQAPTDVQAQDEKQVLYYGVSIREKITTCYPYNSNSQVEIPPMLPNLFTVFYVNTENYQPLIAGVYAVSRTDMIDWNEELFSIGDIVNLKTVTVDYDSSTKRAILNLSSDIRYVLEHTDKYIRPLQDHGRKICLCIEGGGKGLGFCNMNDAQRADFTNQVKNVIEFYNLDGVNLWDEGSEYGKEGMPTINTTSYPKLIKALREALPNKLLTLVDKGEPTESFYDASLCGDIEVGKLIDYAWHGYANEKEFIQIIEPWASDHPYSDYMRKPIAGLTPERYGSVNIPLYKMIGGTPGFTDQAQQKFTKWGQSGRNRNNILVYGNDLTANEQSQYEGAIKFMIALVDNFMPDGGFTSYWYQNSVLDYRLNQGYKTYAKDW